VSKVIILEGPDGGGKTTLAKKLEAMGFKYEHEGPPPANTDLISYYLERLNRAIESSHNTVFDRLWLGERVYGPTARCLDRIGHEGQKLFMRLHNSKSIVQFICLPPWNTVEENYTTKIKDPTDYLKSLDKLQRVYQIYDTLARHYQWKVFNYRLNSVSQVIIETVTIKDVTLPKGTIGSCSAKYLFIGDRPNHEYIDVPFFALNGSSGYLNKAIEIAGIKEEDLALSNVCSPQGKIHLLESMLQSLPNLEKIFLMGNVAHEWFLKNGDMSSKLNVKTFSLQHPSYLKRFHGNNPQVMAEAIQKWLI